MVAALAPAAVAQDWSQGGYASRTSVAQGGSISFHIATATSPFNLQIVNLANPSQVLTTISGLTSAARNCNDLWEAGCGWPVTTQFTIPATWPSGYYAARFPTSAGTRNVIFVVRPATPGAATPFVVISSTHTYLAYNPWGGKSLYDFNSTDGVRAAVGAYQRPYADNDGLGRFPLWEEPFVRWMAGEGRAFDVITDEDLEQDPALLAHYKVAILVGHAEYWSLPARQNLTAFLNGGGHLAVFGGNTMWWQTRFDPVSRRLTCYKDAATDPLRGVDDDVVTVNWFDAPVYNPENFVIGSSFRHGGYANVTAAGSTNPKPDGQRTPYKVTNASNWVFDGTGVTNGQLIGQAAGGIETDGVVFNTTATGTLEVDGSDGAPLNFEILATLPADEGYAVIGMFTLPNGATVFNAGTRDWSHALLAHDPVIEQVTRNLLDRLGTGLPEPYQPRTSDWQTVDLFNTPSPAGPVAGVLPNWGGNLTKAALTSSCAHEGALGLQLNGTTWTQFGRPLTPDGSLLDATEVELWVNADGYTQSATYGFALIELAGTVNGTTTVYGEIEAERVKSGMRVHGIARRPDGTIAAETPSVTLGAGWQQIKFSWRSPGTMELQVGAGTPVQATNPFAGGAVNLMQINFPGSSYGFRGPLCVDELRLKLATGSCTPPSITTQPASSSITAGQSATLSVSATGTGPFTYQWYTGVSGNRTSPVSAATTSTISVSPQNTTSYWAAVTNACGTAESDAATITVCTAPTIAAQPQSASITSGQSTTLSVSANGSGPLTYQWYTGASGNTAAPIANATASSITVSPTSTTSYWVRGTNSCGTADSAAATVTVCTAPSIAAQPQSTSVTSGQSTTLFVSANGSAPLAYQWYTGASGNTAAPLANATASSITVTPTGTTSYWVRVTNSCG
ncbi:MAG: hypothetical protein QOH21_99, partial [Acidobacteriota bacterium]|nr:hypothetical protein [Acidobacteriota bacterium]